MSFGFEHSNTLAPELLVPPTVDQQLKESTYPAPITVEAEHTTKDDCMKVTSECSTGRRRHSYYQSQPILTDPAVRSSVDVVESTLALSTEIVMSKDGGEIELPDNDSCDDDDDSGAGNAVDDNDGTDLELDFETIETRPPPPDNATSAMTPAKKKAVHINEIGAHLFKANSTENSKKRAPGAKPDTPVRRQSTLQRLLKLKL